MNNLSRIILFRTFDSTKVVFVSSLINKCSKLYILKSNIYFTSGEGGWRAFISTLRNLAALRQAGSQCLSWFEHEMILNVKSFKLTCSINVYEWQLTKSHEEEEDGRKLWQVEARPLLNNYHHATSPIDCQESQSHHPIPTCPTLRAVTFLHTKHPQYFNLRFIGMAQSDDLRNKTTNAGWTGGSRLGKLEIAPSETKRQHGV